MQLQVDISHVVVNVAFWVTLAFPFVTRIFWDWTDSWWGKNIVILEVLIAFALVSAIIKIDFGLSNSIGLEWFTISSVFLIPVVVIQRVFLIYGAQRSDLAQAEEKIENGEDQVGSK